MTLRPCLTCGEPCEGARCPQHRRPDRRPSRQQRGYDEAWTRLSKRARARQPWCLDCGSTEDLTGDHLHALALGGRRRGLTLADVAVRCRSCNAKRGAALPSYEQPALTLRDGGEPPRAEVGGAPRGQASSQSHSTTLGDSP